MKFNLPVDRATKIDILTFPSYEHIATGYNRVVIGKRGPYVEFELSQLVIKNMSMPSSEVWRQFSSNAFYLEYRTHKDYVMVYFQKRPVTYADYKISMFYISPLHLGFYDKKKEKHIPLSYNGSGPKTLFGGCSEEEWWN